jgi:SlyX protein
VEDIMKERLTELEVRFMQQEHTIQELNEAVYRQEQAIMKLEREFALLNNQLRVIASSLQGGTDEEERPPHY